MTQDSAAVTPVRLVGFPALLFAAAVEQWESLLREYSLRGLGGAVQSFDHGAVNRGRDALDVLSDAAAQMPSTGDGPLQATADLAVGIASPSDFAILQAVLHDARRLSLTGELLSVPTLPELAALRNWVCEEVTGQAAGAAAQRWRPEVIHDDPDGPPAATWDPAIVPFGAQSWLVGDDHNRIVGVGPAAAELLGWGPDLVGQRLLAIVPPALRQAHIAGFQRSVVAGHGALLGQPLALPALRADGTQVDVWLTITLHPAERGRHVYLGMLAPREADEISSPG